MNKIENLRNNIADLTKIDKHISISYLLISSAMIHIETAEQILRKYGLSAREIKQIFNKIEHNFDRFDSEIRQIMSEPSKKEFNVDMTVFGKMVDDYANITTEDYK